MLIIKINKKDILDEENQIKQKEYLIVNEIPDEDSIYLGPRNPSAYIYNKDVIDILTNHSFNEVGIFLSKFGFKINVDWWSDRFELDILCNNYFHEKTPCIIIELQFQEWDHWDKPWSMSSFAKELEINIKGLGNENIKYLQEDSNTVLNGFGLEYYPQDKSSKIKSEIDSLLKILEKLIDTTNKSLIQSFDINAIFTYFKFPADFKTACKQYLVYFAQFVEDMGILVDTELKEEINYTLFKIIPKNKDESLEKIREALNIYLNAPNEKNFQIEISNQIDLAAKQWNANLFHLQSQLSLAASIIQSKEATIEMLQLSNYQYKQLLESHITRESEKEEIIKGIVTVQKYEGKGFSIDLAEIFRRLKRSVLKKDSGTIK